MLGALSLLLNQGGLQQIQVIARELNSALKGNEAPIRDLLNQLNTFVGTLDNQKSTITTALDNINTLAIDAEPAEDDPHGGARHLPGGAEGAAPTSAPSWSAC